MTDSKKGRKPLAAAEVIDVQMNEVALSEASRALTVLAPRDQAILERFNEGEPYDRVRLVDEAKFFLDQSAAAMLEIGRRLIVLKEMEAKGTFHEIVESRLGIGIRSAQLFMQAAAKLSSLQREQAHQLSKLGRTKIFALMHEDQEVLSAFLEGGTIAGLTFEKIDAASVSELKAALTEERKQKAVKDRLLKEAGEEKQKLKERLYRRTSSEPAEREAAQLDLLRGDCRAAETALLRALSTIDTVMSEAATEAADLAARHSIDFLVQKLVDACLSRGITVDLEERVRPIWAAPIDAAVSAGHAEIDAKAAAKSGAAS